MKITSRFNIYFMIMVLWMKSILLF